MNYIEPCDRYQYVVACCLDDSILEDSIIRVIDRLVDKIIEDNAQEFGRERKNNSGRPYYSDSTMLKLYLYGYMNKINSSRRLEKETYRNIELIWLLGNLSPDHWTISNYRKENLRKIRLLTKLFRSFLRAKGYIGMELVSIDGTKIKANTNKDMLTKSKIEKKLDVLGDKIEEYIEALRRNDIQEDIEEDIEELVDVKIEEKYIEKIINLERKIEELQEAKNRLESEGRNYISLSDKDVNLLKSRDGLIPGYNYVVATDSKNKLILSDELYTDITDAELLSPMVERIKEEYDELPSEILSDNGFSNLDVIEDLESEHRDTKLLVSQQKEKKDTSSEGITFSYAKERDEYICSEGKRLPLHQKNKKKKNSIVSVYKCKECSGCRKRDLCTKSTSGRMVHRYKNQEWRDKYMERIRSELSKEKLRKRKGMIEHAFGTIKCMMGKIPLLLRGKNKVKIELSLYSLVYNLKRLVNIEKFETIWGQIENYNWKAA